MTGFSLTLHTAQLTRLNILCCYVNSIRSNSNAFPVSLYNEHPDNLNRENRESSLFIRKKEGK